MLVSLSTRSFFPDFMKDEEGWDNYEEQKGRLELKVREEEGKILSTGVKKKELLWQRMSGTE